LEHHLSQVCENHNLAIKKKATLIDYYQTLKDNDVIEVATWRFIQRLGDLRNSCVHNKEKEPKKEEIEELIDGVDKITKTLF
jgi:Asp-tRNA(Asn)/Glu-tRNA(Gln) amidotransferase B subunit